MDTRISRNTHIPEQRAFTGLLTLPPGRDVVSLWPDTAGFLAPNYPWGPYEVVEFPPEKLGVQSKNQMGQKISLLFGDSSIETYQEPNKG